MTEFIVFLADGLIWVALAFAIVLLALDLWKGAKSQKTPWKRIKSANWRKIGFVLLAGLLALMISLIFHLIPVEEFRPYQILMVRPLVMPSIDTPFPSDHVMFAFALSFAVIFMTKFKKIGLISLALAFGVLAGRILALVHTPLDVLGGILCAALGAAVWYYLYYRETPKNLPGDLKKLWAEIKSISVAIWGWAKDTFRRIVK